MARNELNQQQKADVRSLISEDKPELLVETAEHVGRELVNLNLKANQIRNIFGTARQINAQWRPNSSSRRRELILLKPKLVYQSARMKEVAELAKWLTEAIDAVTEGNTDEETEYQRFLHFMDFFEAILAYHKAFGGRD